MTERQKIDFFVKRVKFWSKLLCIDPHNDIAVCLDSEDREVGDGRGLPEWLKLEERTVTQMSRALVGHTKFQKYSRLLDKGPGSTLAFCDDGMAQYWRFRIVIYQALLWYNGDDFKCVADVIACHETLHVMLWPTTSYMMSLEEK
jgi:hypothetical protein